MNRWRSREGADEVNAARLIEEAEQFLSGRYLETALAGAADLPAATWLSAIAHGDTTMVARVARSAEPRSPLPPEYETWGRVLEQLAMQTEELVETTAIPLERIQRNVLIPLELALLLSPTGPATLYRLVCSMFELIAENPAPERSS
jgi:hypothetical protein